MNANAPDIDHTIDRALSGLRDAQPRSGLEGRILTSLEHRTATPQPARFHISTHLALWTAALAAVLAVASMTILHYRVMRAKNAVILSEARAHHEPPQNAVILSERSESKNPDTTRRATNSQPFSSTNLTQIANALSSRPEPGAPSSTRVARQGGVGATVHEPPFESATNATTPSDAQALADLHAPSHPAPPLPLTRQEKLFLHMLQYGNATQIAELNPLVRAKEAADETAAFKAFFPDPPPVQQPNGDTE